MRTLLTIPVHNERKRIVHCLDTLSSALDKRHYVIAVAEDGSTDGTKEVLKKYRETHPEIILESSEERLGRGAALTQLWSRTDADIYCYVDADLPAGVQGVVRVVGSVLKGADFATGSRYCVGATVNRPPVVKLASLSYNQLVRWIFGDPVRDHQCGLKALSRRAFQILVGSTREPSWFWDTEVLVLAHARGFSVAEVPLDWRENRYARTNFRRLFTEVPYFMRALVSLNSRLGSDDRASLRADTDSSTLLRV